MIELVIFDLDGVVVSTTEAHYTAWANLFLKHFSIVIDPKLETKTRGVSRMDSLQALLDAYQIDLDSSVKEALANEKNTEYVRLISSYSASDLLPGAYETLKLLRKLKVKIALGSASKNGPRLLKSLGISNYFDYVVDPSHIEGKPNPAIFLDAMQHFNLKPELCLGVEDSEAGVVSIKAAGMKALGVGTEVLDKSDYKVLKLTELNENDWKALLEK